MTLPFLGPLVSSFCVCLHSWFSVLVIPRGAPGGAHRNTSRQTHVLSEAAPKAGENRKSSQHVQGRTGRPCGEPEEEDPHEASPITTLRWMASAIARVRHCLAEVLVADVLVERLKLGRAVGAFVTAERLLPSLVRRTGGGHLGPLGFTLWFAREEFPKLSVDALLIEAFSLHS
jgi:hypothetical protein